MNTKSKTKKPASGKSRGIAKKRAIAKNVEKSQAAKPAPTETTSSLFPVTPPVPVFEGSMPVSEIPKSDFAAEDSFVENVRRFGILVPLLLTRSKDGKIKIIDGRRRRWVAGMIGMTDVPVQVYQMDATVSESALISTNEHRSTNWVALFDAVVSLLKTEPNENALANALSVDLSRIRKVLTLRNLIDPLMRAWRRDEIKASVAFKAARLTSDSQDALAAVLKEKGGLTDADVSEIRPSKPKDETLDLAIPKDRSELKRRLTGAIMDASAKGSLDIRTPEYLAEYLTRCILGEPLMSDELSNLTLIGDGETEQTS